MNALAPESEHLQRGMHGDVRLGADDDFDLRRAVEPARLDVPARALRECMAGGGERREVRRLAAGDEADTRSGGQAEELAQPAAGGLLGDGVRRRQDEETGVLVPGRGQPVDGDRHRQRAADHEAEVARAGGGDDARVGAARQVPEDRLGALARLRQSAAERPAHVVDGRGAADRTLRQALEVVAGDLRRAEQKVP